LKKSFLQSLKRRSEFQHVFDQGRKFPSKYLILYFLPNDLGFSRLGLVVSRKVGNAVTRNRVRRRIREIFRTADAANSLNFDIVVVARSIAGDAEYQSLEKSILRAFAGSKNENTVHNNNQAL
jgi:ribonuclease P protein component